MNAVAASAEPVGAASLLPLLVWASPAFPVGAFAYSHGIEWCVERGDIRDAASLNAWLADLLAHGPLRNDAILFAAAYRLVASARWAELREINDLALALASSRERHLETAAQGSAFVTVARTAWACAALEHLAASCEPDVAYPVAFATAAAGHGLELGGALEAFLIGFSANLISAAVRLGAIGQTAGQAITAGLMPDVRALAAFAATASLDELGSAAFRSDLAALQHETQYSRLFRS